MIVVLDASSILSGRLTSLAGLEAYITPDVESEVEKGKSNILLQNLILAGLIVRSPLDLEPAKRVARDTGDISHLSGPDISVIALAIELKATVITDDFRVQNVLRAAGLAFQPGGEIGDRTIEKVWNWRFRCKGCGRYYEKELTDCPVCGSGLKSVRSRG